MASGSFGETLLPVNEPLNVFEGFVARFERELNRSGDFEHELFELGPVGRNADFLGEQGDFILNSVYGPIVGRHILQVVGQGARWAPVPCGVRTDRRGWRV